MPRLALLVVSLVVIVACKEANPSSCELPENAGMNGCPGDANGGGSCRMDLDCKEPLRFPVCDTAVSQCFVCSPMNQGLCRGQSMPHCEDHACVGCFDDTDCDGGAGVCLTSGACAAPPLLYARSDGSGTAPCTASAPCSLEAALNLAKTAPSTIKLVDTGMFKAELGANFVVDTTRPVVIDARGATLIPRMSDKPIITIMPGTVATILGGTIANATGPNGDGIRCGGGTLTVRGTVIKDNDGIGLSSAMCTLEVGRARIGPGNKAGGLKVSMGTFVVVGNYVMGNGNDASDNPGVAIDTTVSSTNRFEFNTVAENRVGKAIVTGGVDCKAGSGFTAKYNIIWNNAIMNSAAPQQTANSCAHAVADIGPVAVASNLSEDPRLGANGELGNQNLTKKADATADLSGIAERDAGHDRRIKPADLGADQITKP